MADEVAKGGEQLVGEQENTEKADQLDDQVEDAEKQAETTSEPSTEKDGETAEANVNDPDKAEDTSKAKDTEETAAPTDKEEESSEPATPSFPKTLEGFGYKFNENGQLRQIENDEPFLFKVKDSDQKYNQAHYEALGEVITEHVYQLLESDGGLIRTDIPVDVKSDEARSFIFESADARTADKLIVIIHGSGVVRAGQWSRRLIINDCLDSGTQLPFIKRSLENSYGVLILNTNRNSDIVNGEELPVRESESVEAHTEYVWDHVISKCAAKQIDIVAHSYGGVAVLYLVVERFDEVKNKVEKIAFTDSAHSITRQCQDLTHKEDITQWFSKHTINWVSSDKPLDTVIANAGGDAARLSAGTKIHEETSWYSFASIFKYFTSKEDYMQAVIKPEEPVTKAEDEPVSKTEEPVTKTEDEPVSKTEEPVTKTEDEPVTKTEEPVTKTEDEPVTKTEEPVTKTEDEPVTKTQEPVTKTEDEPVTKTEEPVTKTEDEPVTKTKEPVTKTEDEPVTKTEEPVTKTEDEPVTKTKEPVTKTEDEPVTKTKEPVTKTEDEPVTKTEEPVTKTEDEPVTKTEEPVTKTEDEPVTKTEEPVTKTEDEPVTKTEEPVTKTEDEPVTKTEEPVTKSEEPVTKSEEPVPKSQDLDKDIDKRIDDSSYHQSGKKLTESHPSDDVEPTNCCVII